MDGVDNNHIVDIESILGKLIKCILVYLIPAVGLKVTTLVFRLSIIRGTNGGWWMALGHGICIGWPQKNRCIICLCFFVLFFIHQRGVAIIEGTTEVIFVDAKFFPAV